MKSAEYMSQIPEIPRRRSLPNTLAFVHDPIGALAQYGAEYGPSYYLYIGGVQRSLVTTDPVLAQHVLQQNHRNYEKSVIQTDTLAKYVGRGLLTNTGASWLRQRRLIQPGFHRSRLEALTALMQSVIDAELDDVARGLATPQPLDAAELMLRVAFRIVAKAIFSDDIAEAELADFGDKITRIQEHVIREVRLPFLRWWLRLTGRERLHLQLSQEVLGIQQTIIARRRASGVERHDLLQMLLDSRYEDTGLPMDDEQLIHETGILFVAGHETSANALAWTLYLLAQHPDVQQRVRDELDAVSPGAPPNFEQLRQLTYLTQVINEAMRLYPPAWITDRVALADDEVAGVKIPRGTLVVPYIYGIHHDAGLWPDPEAFRPDRFAPDQRKGQEAFAFLPFGGGPRLCIGNSFAMMEMQLVVAAWLRRFDFGLLPGAPVVAQPLITLRPKGGIGMTVAVRGGG